MAKRATLKEFFLYLTGRIEKLSVYPDSEKYRALQELNLLTLQELQAYRPKPSSRRMRIKRNGEKSPILVPDKGNKYLQQIVLEYLNRYFDSFWHHNVFGWRRGYSVSDAIRYAKRQIKQGNNRCVRMDLKDCFQNLLCSELRQALLESGIISPRLISKIFRLLELTPDSKGIPQGHPLAPFLANMILTKLDNFMDDKGWRFYRYGDDVTVFASSGKEACKIRKQLVHFIEEQLELPINIDKTKVTRVWGHNFLGYTFYRAKNKVLVYPSSINQAALKYAIRRILETTPDINEAFRLINQKLTGWANAFRLINSKKFLKELDEWIQYQTIEYILSTHKNKGLRFQLLKWVVGVNLARKLAAMNLQKLRNGLEDTTTERPIPNVLSLYEMIKSLGSTIQTPSSSRRG